MSVLVFCCQDKLDYFTKCIPKFALLSYHPKFDKLREHSFIGKGSVQWTSLSILLLLQLKLIALMRRVKVQSLPLLLVLLAKKFLILGGAASPAGPDAEDHQGAGTNVIKPSYLYYIL